MLLIDSFSAELLRDRLQGHLVLPDEEDYDDARRAWNLSHDLRPAIVALPATADDVRDIVLYAREQNLRVLVQGTGHNGTPVGDLSDTILVRTSAMRGVEIDAGARIARVQAGAVWSDVTAPASEHGLAPLAGSAPDVGVVGYCVGGGLGWLGRRYGLCSERVLSFDVVTADGRLVHVDRESEPDLFWALRGGGGAYAAIVALELELIPVPAVTAGMMIFGWERAREVLQAWRTFTWVAPDTVTTATRIMQVPDTPAVPEAVRGRGIVAIDGAILASAAEAAAVLAPLRALGPEIDTFADVPPVALSYIHWIRRATARSWWSSCATRAAPWRGRAQRCCRTCRASTSSSPGASRWAPRPTWSPSAGSRGSARRWRPGRRRAFSRTSRSAAARPRRCSAPRRPRGWRRSGAYDPDRLFVGAQAS